MSEEVHGTVTRTERLRFEQVGAEPEQKAAIKGVSAGRLTGREALWPTATKGEPKHDARGKPPAGSPSKDTTQRNSPPTSGASEHHAD